MTEKTLDREQTKKQVDAIVGQLGDQLPKDAAPKIEEAIQKIVIDKKSPKDVLGLTPQVMEVIYQQGYHFFQSGKYADALIIFNILRFFDITDPRYTFAIAGCYHYQKDYLNAAANYLIYKVMDPLNPIPSFHLYDCFVKANYPTAALLYIQEALALAGMDPKYANLKEKIALESEHFNTTLKPYFDKKYKQ